MILVDKEIRELTANNQLISSGFNINNLNGVSYDLTLDHILDESGNKHEKYDLSPGETVFIRTKEQLSIPKNILGRIAEKNSRMRQGLKVDGPHYQPGHVTYAYLRVQNISHQIIELSSGIRIAQIFFEQLSQVPDSTYDLQPNASFQNETSYRGLGNYKAEYEQQTKQYIEQEKENIERISEKIYANVLTIMGIVAAIFAMITINFEAFAKANLDFKFIITMNLSMALCVVIMLGIILILINHARDKRFTAIYLVILILLSAAIILIA